MNQAPKYDYGFDPDADNNTAAAIFRLARAGGRRVLDIGAGPGVVASALAAEGFETVCLDNDEDALAVAAERGVGRTVVADLRNDDWVAQVAGEPYDTVVLADVLEHMVDPGHLLDLLHEHELLAPDGQLLVSVPNVGHESVVLGLALGRFRYTETGLLDATHLRFFTRDSLHALLEEHGFLVHRLHRTTRSIEQTEQFQVARDVPDTLRRELQSLSDDAGTYQFVVAAVPSTQAGQLAVLRERLEAERDDHVRALKDLRRSLHDEADERHEAAVEERTRVLEQRLSEATGRVGELTSALESARRDLDEERRAHAQLRRHGDAGEVRELRRALRRAEDRLDQVYDSTAFRVGWQLTTPVRRLKGKSTEPVRPERVTPRGDGGGGRGEDPEPPRRSAGRRGDYEQEVARRSFSPGAHGVVMLCSTTDLDAGRGDVYAACGLGLGLRSHGMEAVYLPHERWDELPEGTEVVVSYLAERTMVLDPATLPPGVLRVAWVRNNTARWIREGALGLYDLVLCSSVRTADEIGAHYDGPVEVLPLGVDDQLFTLGVEGPRPNVVSTVNQWGSERRTYRALAAAELDVPVHVYGRKQGLDPRLERHHRGLVSYFEIPSVYERAAVVLDDQQGVNAPFGNVNSRIYEALAAGALPLTSSPLGLAEVGLDDVPVWRADDELAEQIRYWTEHEQERRELVTRLRAHVVAQHTFSARAARFVELLTDRPRRRPSVLGFYPDYRVTNPFQDMLYTAARGRVVRPVQGPDELTEAPGLQDHERIFHLHWVATILGPAHDDAIDAQQRADAFLASLDRAKAAGVGIVWTVHNVLHHESRHPGIETRMRQGIADRADLVHVLSEATLREVAEAGYTLPEERTLVGSHPSYLGVYPSAMSREAARRELGLPDSAFVYLVLGQIRPYKGLERVLDAFDTVARRDADARLLVAGLPGKFEGVEELVTRARATIATTVVAEHVEDERLQVFLRACDVVVLPHRRVLNSGLLWLAWSFARPVVAPDTGSLSDLVDPDVGVLFAPDVDDLAPALLAARDLGREHGAVAFERACATHPREVSAALLAAIQQAVAPERASDVE